MAKKKKKSKKRRVLSFIKKAAKKGLKVAKKHKPSRKGFDSVADDFWG